MLYSGNLKSDTGSCFWNDHEITHYTVSYKKLFSKHVFKVALYITYSLRCFIFLNVWTFKTDPRLWKLYDWQNTHMLVVGTVVSSVPQDMKARTLPLMTALQMGQWRRLVAQSLHTTRCPQGMKTMDTSLSIHTLQVRSSCNWRSSSSGLGSLIATHTHTSHVFEVLYLGISTEWNE